MLKAVVCLSQPMLTVQLDARAGATSVGHRLEARRHPGLRRRRLSATTNPVTGAMIVADKNPGFLNGSGRADLATVAVGYTTTRPPSRRLRRSAVAELEEAPWG